MRRVTFHARLLGLCSLLAILSFASAGAVPGLYIGRVGNFPVVMQLDRADEGEGGRYAYLSRGLDLPLGVRWSAGNVTLTEYVPPNWGGSPPRVNAVFQGKLSGDTLSGTWHPANGRRTLPFRLSRVQPTALPLALPSSPGALALRTKDPYTFVKLNRTWPTMRREGDLTWVREPLSGTLYPRLAHAPALNAALQDRQLEAAQNALQCNSDLGARFQNEGDGWTQRVRVTYRVAHLLSLREDADYYCGGAHPDAFTNGLTLDLRSGRALTPFDLWPRLTPAKLNELYLRRYPKDDTSDCAGEVQADRDMTRDDYTAFLTPRGLTLWPTYLPHVVLACAEEVTVPYSALGTGTPGAPR